MNKEIRKIESPLTVDEESRTVEGYAVVFESESENLGFFETIKRGAITEELIAQSDVFARFNHDENKVLARSKNGSGSLTLILDDRGLQYRFEAPKTALGDELLEYLKRGDITASSFCFAIDPEDASAEKWENRSGILYRTINHIAGLYDVAPVFQPAYSATSCSNRFAEVKATCDEVNAAMDAIVAELESL